MNKYKYSIVWGGKLYQFARNDKDVLVTDVVKFFRENNINFNFADLNKAIDRQSKLTTPPTRIGLAEAVNGAKAVLKYAGGNSVSSQEIIRRSEICAACPLIDRIGGCSACGAAGRIAGFINNLRAKLKLQIEIPATVKSSFCPVCKCSLALMVVSEKIAFNEPLSLNSTRPDNCWLKTTSKNYTNE